MKLFQGMIKFYIYNILQEYKFQKFITKNSNFVIGMGNISQIGYPLNNISNRTLTQNPSTRSQQFSDQQISSYNGLSHTFNPNEQTFVELNISDQRQLQFLTRNLQRYSKNQKDNNDSNLVLFSQYPSISTLKQYYRLKKEGYCTNSYTFYLIFDVCNCCGLKQEIGKRKLQGESFNYRQIHNILKTLLAGLTVYVKQFKHHIQKIDIDDIAFQLISKNNPIISHQTINNHQLNNLYSNFSNQRHLNNKNNKNNRVRLYFIDPYIKEKREQQLISVNQINILLQNPSPQKLQAKKSAYNNYHSDSAFDTKAQHNQEKINEGINQFSNEEEFLLNQKFYSLLFSVGVIGLKLLQMNFVDDIYTKFPAKKVNFQRIESYLLKHQSFDVQKNRINNKNNYHRNPTINELQIHKALIEGLKLLLLSKKPEDRQKIYNFWKVNLNQLYELDCLMSQPKHQANQQSPFLVMTRNQSDERIIQQQFPPINSYTFYQNRQISNIPETLDRSNYHIIDARHCQNKQTGLNQINNYHSLDKYPPNKGLLYTQRNPGATQTIYYQNGFNNKNLNYPYPISNMSNSYSPYKTQFSQNINNTHNNQFSYSHQNLSKTNYRQIQPKINSRQTYEPILTQRQPKQLLIENNRMPLIQQQKPINNSFHSLYIPQRKNETSYYNIMSRQPSSSLIQNSHIKNNYLVQNQFQYSNPSNQMTRKIVENKIYTSTNYQPIQRPIYNNQSSINNIRQQVPSNGYNYSLQKQRINLINKSPYNQPQKIFKYQH